MNEIRSYSEAMGILPTTVIQKACGYGGTVWKRWQNGGSCSLKAAKKIRKYMADNPPSVQKEARS